MCLASRIPWHLSMIKWMAVGLGMSRVVMVEIHGYSRIEKLPRGHEVLQMIPLK